MNEMTDEMNNDISEAQMESASEAVINDDLVKVKEEFDALNLKFLRLAADYENTRRRLTKDIEDANKFGVSSFAKAMLEIVDTLEIALSHVSPSDVDGNQKFADLFNGLKMATQEMHTKFAKFGIEKIDPVDQKFDHNLHEAVSRVPHNSEPGFVVNVLRCGYSVHGRLLRPAMVVVSMGPVKAS